MPNGTATKPLTAAEQRTLTELLTRASLLQSPHAPAIRIGEEYVALINLSVPRRTNSLVDAKDRQVDLVRRGETVWLTDEEARLFMRADPDRDGRQIPVIQKVNGPESKAEQPFLLPRLVSGRQFGPPVHARADPAGSSFVQQVAIPEATPAAPGTEQVPQADAIDLPPTRSAAREAVAGVDQELVDRARAQMPPMPPGKN
jgi:hypothetical protein